MSSRAHAVDPLAVVFPEGVEQLHRLIVRFAMAGSWFAAVLLVVVAAAGGNDAMYVEALGPLSAALVFTIQLAGGRPNAAFALSAGVIIVVVSHGLVGTASTTLAASIAVVAMVVMAAAFVERRVIPFLLGVGTMLVFVPSGWAVAREGMVLPGALATGATMSLSFLVGALAFLLVRNSFLRTHRKYQALFEAAPVGLMEQDWSEALAFLQDQGLTSGEAARRAVQANPALARDVAARVRSRRANAAIMEVLEAQDEAVLLGPAAVTGATFEAWVEQIAVMVDGHGMADFEFPMRTFGGSDVWVGVRSIMSPSSDPTHLLLAVTDITTLKEAHDALAGSIEAKNQFIASVSHELRTPLTVVVGLATELADASDLEEEERDDLLRLLATQSREIQYIVEDLLVAARADIGAVSIADESVDLLDETYSVFGELGESPDAVAVEGRLPRARGDRVRVRQVIRNLVANAHRYGGLRRRLMLSGEGGTVVLEMRDSGEPLSEEDRDRIFAPYERAHDRAGVTASVGLGLSVSRQLARLMGGDLVYDHDGEAVFRFTLPVDDSAESRAGSERLAPVEA